jgi:hypothetical protein
MQPGIHGGKHVGWVRLSDGRTFTRDDVLASMRQGVVFYTYAPTTGHQAKVIPYRCPRCGTTYLTTDADAWKDDNLDKLPLF